MRDAPLKTLLRPLLGLGLLLTACGSASTPDKPLPPAISLTVHPSVSRAVPGQLVEIAVEASSGNGTDLSGVSFQSTLGPVFTDGAAHGVLQIPQGTTPTVATIQAQKNGATVGEATITVESPVAATTVPADHRTATLPVAAISVPGTGVLNAVTATDASSPTTTLPAAYPQATHALYLNFSQPTSLRDGTVSKVVLAFSGLDYKNKDYLFDATFYNQNRVLQSTLLKADPVTNVVQVPVAGLSTAMPADEAALPITLAVQGVEMPVASFTSAALRSQATSDQSATVQVMDGVSVQSGLWAINDIQSNFSTLRAACDSHDQTLRPSSSIINYLPGEPISTTKTPLIFVHGWQALADHLEVASALPADLVKGFQLTLERRFEEAAQVLNLKQSPGICTWTDDLKQLQDSGALSNYQVYVFGYNSYDSIASNITRLQAFVSHIDSPASPVVVAHSMGGIIAQGVEARAPGSFGQIISFGSPYLGTTALTCRELSADAQSCAQASLNPGLIRNPSLNQPVSDLTNPILLILTRFQGTRDLAWRTPVAFDTYPFTPLPIFSKTEWTKGNPGLPSLPSVLYNSAALYGQVTGDQADSAKFVHNLISSGGDENDGIVPTRSACLSFKASTDPDNACSDSRFATQPTRITINHMDMTGIKAIDALGKALQANHLAVTRYALTVGDMATLNLTGSANGVTYRSENASAVTVAGSTIRASQPVSTPVAVFGSTTDGIKHYVAYVTVKAAEQAPVLITVRPKSTTVSTGGDHSMALKTDGTLWIFGLNDSGQLGEGTTIDRHSPVMIMSSVASVSAGSDHSMALKTDGTLWTFGGNGVGQLGDGTTTTRYSPVMVMSGVASVSAGFGHSLILKTDGTLWSSGGNGAGQLGDGTTTTRYSPVMVMSGVASISAGYRYSLALKTDGTLWGFGVNKFGQLGDGTTFDRHSPVMVMSGVKSISAGGDHSMALKADGTLWAFGLNDSGQLGDGTTIDRHSPVMVMSGIASVSAGFYHSLALKADGTLWAFGFNGIGQLGDGTTIDRHAPVMIMSSVASLSAGGDSSLALKTNGGLWTFGFNGFGQLGDNTTTTHYNPVITMSDVAIPR